MAYGAIQGIGAGSYWQHLNSFSGSGSSSSYVGNAVFIESDIFSGKTFTVPELPQFICLDLNFNITATLRYDYQLLNVQFVDGVTKITGSSSKVPSTNALIYFNNISGRPGNTSFVGSVKIYLSQSMVGIGNNTSQGCKYGPLVVSAVNKNNQVELSVGKDLFNDPYTVGVNVVPWDDNNDYTYNVSYTGDFYVGSALSYAVSIN